MIRTFTLAMALLWSPTTIFSQSPYFDIGIGIGSAKTTAKGISASSQFSSGVTETGVAFGLKFGFGPVGNLPLYGVGEISGIGHRFNNSSNYVQSISFLAIDKVTYIGILLFKLDVVEAAFAPGLG